MQFPDDGNAKLKIMVQK